MGMRKHGVRIGNWLTIDQGHTLLQAFDRTTLGGKRDYAMIAVLLGCGLGRAELAAVTLADLQRREEHRVFAADLIGKGGHVRTISVPDWVGSAIQGWLTAAAVTAGTMFRALNKAGRVAPNGFSPKVIWSTVRTACHACALPAVAPHELRGTCARLCHDAGGEVEQIRYLLVMRASRRLSDTSAVSSGSETRSTIGSGWSLRTARSK